MSPKDQARYPFIPPSNWDTLIEPEMTVPLLSTAVTIGPGVATIVAPSQNIPEFLALATAIPAENLKDLLEAEDGIAARQYSLQGAEKLASAFGIDPLLVRKSIASWIMPPGHHLLESILVKLDALQRWDPYLAWHCGYALLKAFKIECISHKLLHNDPWIPKSYAEFLGYVLDSLQTLRTLTPEQHGRLTQKYQPLSWPECVPDLWIFSVGVHELVVDALFKYRLDYGIHYIPRAQPMFYTF